MGESQSAFEAVIQFFQHPEADGSGEKTIEVLQLIRIEHGSPFASIVKDLLVDLPAAAGSMSITTSPQTGRIFLTGLLEPTC